MKLKGRLVWQLAERVAYIANSLRELVVRSRGCGCVVVDSEQVDCSGPRQRAMLMSQPFVDRNPRHLLLLALVATTGLACSTAALGMGFRCVHRTPLAQEVASAEIVVVGHLGAAHAAPAGNGAGTTQFVIRQVLKGRALLDNQKTIVLPRYLPDEKSQFLVFADMPLGFLDVYRGLPIPGKADELVDYLIGAVGVLHAPPLIKLGYHFRFLNHPNDEIAQDARLPFDFEKPRELLAAAPSFDPDRLVGWLLDARTPEWRRDLFGYLLGLSRRPEDAELLRRLWEEQMAPKRESATKSYSGLLAGYCLTAPTVGVEFAGAVMTDAKREFTQRYSALRALRFAMEASNDVDRTKVFLHLQTALAQNDFADLVIEDLRRNRHWNRPDLVLDLYGKPGLEPIVRRAVLRYALSCPDPLAKAFIVQVRAKDPERVADVEDLLRLEQQGQRIAYLQARWWLAWMLEVEKALGVAPAFRF